MPIAPPCQALFLVPSLRGGGAERTLVTLLNHLDGSRIHAALGVVDLRGAVYLSDLRSGVEVIDLDCRRVRYAMPKIVSLVKKRRPRVVLSTLGHLNLALAIARTLLPPNVRVIGRELTLASHGIRDFRARALWEWAYRRFYPRLDRVICESRATHDDLVEKFGFPADRAIVINNPLDVERIRALAKSGFAPEFRTRDSDGASIELVAVGRLSPEKGLDLLIDAIAICDDPRIRVSILGEGPLESGLREQAAARGLADRIRFLGFQRNPYPYMAHADALVLSSRFEGSPNVVLEAMACGTPVIACPAAGGIREILGGIEQCEIADDVSAPALASAIIRFLQCRPERVPESAVALYSAGHIARIHEKAILDAAVA